MIAALCMLVIATYAQILFTPLQLTGPNPADAYYNRLADGLLHGQLSLRRAAPPGLSQLHDPYDPAASAPFRSLGSPQTVHDLSYFRNRLHLYFGVSPAVLLFGPYHLVTGGWLSHAEAVLVFTSLGFLLFTAVLIGCWRRYFPGVQFALLLLGITALGLVTPGLQLMQRADVWEVAVTSAGAFTAAVLACLWLALHARRGRALWIALASACFGAAVGARPTVAPAAVVLLFPLAQLWRAARLNGEPLAPRTALRYAMAAIVPLGFVVVALLAYNEFRFGSLWEFGQRYQLAGDRQDAAAHFKWSYVGFHLRMYLLSPAQWSTVMPFVLPSVLPPLPPGHGPAEAVWGLLPNFPYCLFAFATPLVLGRKSGTSSELRWFLGANALLFATAATAICLFYAMTARYQFDFAPEWLLFATLGVFALDRRAGRWRRTLHAVVLAALAFSIAVNLGATTLLRATRRYQYGLSLLANHETERAVPQLERALYLKPDLTAARATLLRTYVDLRRPADAQAQFTQLLQDPGGPPIAIDYARYLSAIGQIEPAYRSLAQAAQQWPRSAEIHNAFGVACQRTGRLAEARQHFETALRLDPKNVAVLCNAGALVAQQGNVTQARQYFAAAVAADDRNATAHYLLAEAYLELDQTTAARSELERVLQLQPDFAEARRALEAIHPSPSAGGARRETNLQPSP